ncbi:transposase, partial [Undibacterium sp. GrIS 1.2]
MYSVELYVKVRRAVMVDKCSEREAARLFGVHHKTVKKMCQFAVPPGYQRKSETISPKLAPFTGIIDAILDADKQVHVKQRHTAHRILERLRDEHGFTGGYTIVRNYVYKVATRQKEMFIPLAHRPSHAQVDLGEADGYIGGKKVRFHYFCMDLPHSDGCFVKAYPTEDTESFLDGHIAAFTFFGGIPQSILYDNTKIAVAKILGDGKRLRTKEFGELQSHYLFDDKFGRPARGNDKGNVEGLVGYSRRHFMVPLPIASDFDALNAKLLDGCIKRQQAKLRGETETIAERMQRDTAALMALPHGTYDACHKVSTRVSSLSLVRYRCNDYSVPTEYGHREVLVKGYVNRVEICLSGDIIARHVRNYGREEFIYNPLHYL